MKKYIYRGRAYAWAGKILKPVEKLIDAQAPSVLPSNGGRSSSSVRNVNLDGVVAFESAYSEVNGRQDPATGAYRTDCVSTLLGLNIENVVTAEELTVRITSQFREGDRKPFIHPGGTVIRGLRVRGEPVEVPLDMDFAQDPASYDNFRPRYPEDEISHGEVHTRLGPKQYLDVQGFGRIYFAEWVVNDRWQRLTLLRVEAANPTRGDGPDVEGGGGGFP